MISICTEKLLNILRFKKTYDLKTAQAIIYVERNILKCFSLPRNIFHQQKVKAKTF